MNPHEELELEFARWVGWGTAVACSSGTAALHLALEALQLPPGGEVLVPDFTMVACARACTLAGLTPAFVDCRDDLLVDPGLLKRALQPSTSAVMVVHVYGRQADAGAACKLGLPVVEDMAEAPTLAPHPLSAAACWSFHRSKIIAGEEGGAALFREPQRAALARQLRDHGFTAARDFQHVPRGLSCRLAPSLARLALASLRNVNIEVLERLAGAAKLDAACPDELRMPPRACPWVYDVRLSGGAPAAAVRLRAAGIDARCAFRPMSSQLEYRGHRTVGSGCAAVHAQQVLYVPVLSDPRAVFQVLVP